KIPTTTRKRIRHLHLRLLRAAGARCNMHKELDTTLHSKRHDSSPPAEPKPANQRSERSDSPPKDTRTPRPAQRSENKWRRELSTYGYSCLSERLRANAANSRVSEY